jgi:hypothetical protein
MPATVTLCSHRKASLSWRMLLLVSGTADHGMILHYARRTLASGCRTRRLAARSRKVSGNPIWPSFGKIFAISQIDRKIRQSISSLCATFTVGEIWLRAVALCGLQDAIQSFGLRDRSALVLFSHDEFQETEAICCAGVPVGVDRSRRYKQAVTGFQRYGRLAFLLPNA